jgi:hypothetical protein
MNTVSDRLYRKIIINPSQTIDKDTMEIVIAAMNEINRLEREIASSRAEINAAELTVEDGAARGSKAFQISPTVKLTDDGTDYYWVDETRIGGRQRVLLDKDELCRISTFSPVLQFMAVTCQQAVRILKAVQAGEAGETAINTALEALGHALNAVEVYTPKGAQS